MSRFLEGSLLSNILPKISLAQSFGPGFGSHFVVSCGVFSAIVAFCQTHFLGSSVFWENRVVLSLFYCVALVLCFALVIVPLWVRRVSDSSTVKALLLFAVLYNSIFANLLVLSAVPFSPMHLPWFMTNVFITILFLPYGFAAIALILMELLSFDPFGFFYAIGAEPRIFLTTFILLAFIVLIVFLRPRQEEHESNLYKMEHFVRSALLQKHELIKLLSNKHDFLINLQHNAFTPLTVMSSMVNSVDRNYDQMSKTEVKEILREIVSSVNKLRAVITDRTVLSDFWTYGTGQNLPVSHVNFSRLIHERLDFFEKSYLYNRDLRFIRQIERDVNIDCVVGSLSLVLDHLIQNAITYTEFGLITVSFKQQTDVVEFKISDEGKGLAVNNINLIIDDCTVDFSKSVKANTKGLGLAICNAVLKQHGGTIWCDNNPNKGATFCFKLPIIVR